MSSYVLLSDLHLHNWSSFSTINEKGVNSRLAIIIKEVLRAAQEQIKTLPDMENRNMVIAGDVFHVKGSLEPSVLNPVIDMFSMLTEKFNFNIYILAGNHDLEGKYCDRISSAITAIEMPGIRIVNEPTYFKEIEVAMIPWFESLDELRQQIADMRERCGGADLIIHAPVNGVIKGLPDRGLSSDELAEFGFFRIFSGHYHNYVNFGNNIYSIGATTHQTWGDVGSKAGYLLVNESSVTYRASHAPKFVDIDEQNVEEARLLVDGNYVRIKIDSNSMSDIESIREELMGYGALGVVINAVNSGLKVERREGSSATSGITIAESVVAFIKDKDLQPTQRKELNDLCLDILSSAEVVV